MSIEIPRLPSGKINWLKRLEAESLSKNAAQAASEATPATRFLPRTGMAHELLRDFALTMAMGQDEELMAPFHCFAKLEDNATGARAYAYHRHDSSGAREVRLAFPGRSSVLAGPEENETASAIIRGEASPQLSVVKHFAEEQLLPQIFAKKPSHIHIFGHSMGSGNALLTKHMLDKHGFPSTTTLFEPFAPTSAARFILPSDATPEEQKTAFAQLRTGITSIRTHPATGIALMPVGNSRINNKQFGEEAFHLHATPDTPPTEHMSRRKFFSTPIMLADIPLNLLLEDSRIDNKEFGAPGHSLASCVKTLITLGDDAFHGAPATAITSLEEFTNHHQHGHHTIMEMVRGLVEGIFNEFSSSSSRKR